LKSDNEATRLKACQELLDRGYGRPVTPSEVSGPDGGPITTAQLDDREVARMMAFILAQGAQDQGGGKT